MMKFGCNYSFWQNTSKFSIDEYIGMTNTLADCGFDVLEISAAGITTQNIAVGDAVNLDGGKLKKKTS